MLYRTLFARSLVQPLFLFFLTVFSSPPLALAQSDQADLRFVSLAEINTLDPQKMSWLDDIRIGQCLFETLVRIRLPQGDLEPAAAERWQISPDHTQYTFFLRPQARWSNGDPVTADDFLYAWQRALLPDLAADYTQLFFHIAGARDFFTWRTQQLQNYARRPDRSPQAAEELWLQTQQHFAQTVGLAAPDPHTLIIRLEHPTPYFLELLAFITFAPVHKKTVHAHTSLHPDTAMLLQDPSWTRPEKLLSNGPYILARYRFKQDLLLTANPYYWNASAMRNRSILQRHIPDLQAALLAYQRGLVDWFPDLPTARSTTADLVASGRPDVHIYPVAGTYFYNFNCLPTLPNGRKNPLADPRLRRALSLAIDRAAIVQKVTRLHQPIARTFIPPNAIPNYDPPIDAGPDFNPDLARQLLAEAGYSDPRSLTGLSILYNTEGGHEAIAQQIRFSWEKHLGITVTLEGVEKRLFGERLKKHDFTIARAAWIGDYRDPTTFLDKFLTDNGNNDAAYSNPAFDQLLARAAREPDPAARFLLLRQAEALMLADHPIAPIFHYVFVELYHPDRVRYLYSNPWNFRRLELVQVTR